MTEVPCIITHADEEAIKADRIADNKISEFSEWINEELMHEVDSIDLDFDFSELGFPKVSFDDMPTMDDFCDFDDDEEQEISDEQKQKLYQEFLEKQAQESATQVQITSEKAVQKAAEKQHNVGEVQTKYYKCVCEECGHVMYIREGDLVER
jgi:hypothetical protein